VALKKNNLIISTYRKEGNLKMKFLSSPIGILLCIVFSAVAVTAVEGKFHSFIGNILM
jgi:hypothetical protein